MYRFLKFDAVDFLQQSRSFDSQIEELSKELEAISEISGQLDNVGRGSGISDPTARTAAASAGMSATRACRGWRPPRARWVRACPWPWAWRWPRS